MCIMTTLHFVVFRINEHITENSIHFIVKLYITNSSVITCESCNRKVTEKGLWTDKQLNYDKHICLWLTSILKYGIKSNFNVSKSGLTASVHCMQGLWWSLSTFKQMFAYLVAISSEDVTVILAAK